MRDSRFRKISKTYNNGYYGIYVSFVCRESQSTESCIPTPQVIQQEGLEIEAKINYQKTRWRDLIEIGCIQAFLERENMSIL